MRENQSIVTAESMAFKIQMLGEDGVGKRSWILRATEDAWTTDVRAAVQGRGNFATKSLPIPQTDIPVDFQFYDLSEISRTRSATITSMREYHGFILCYDLTQFNTFTSVSSLIRLVQNLKKGTAPPFIIVGLKSDLSESAEVTDAHIIRLSPEIRALHFVCSSLTGEGIEDAITAISQALFTAFHSQLTAYAQSVGPKTRTKNLLHGISKALGQKHQPDDAPKTSKQEYCREPSEELAFQTRRNAICAQPLPPGISVKAADALLERAGGFSMSASMMSATGSLDFIMPKHKHVSPNSAPAKLHISLDADDLDDSELKKKHPNDPSVMYVQVVDEVQPPVASAAEPATQNYTLAEFDEPETNAEPLAYALCDDSEPASAAPSSTSSLSSSAASSSSMSTPPPTIVTSSSSPSSKSRKGSRTRHSRKTKKKSKKSSRKSSSSTTDSSSSHSSSSSSPSPSSSLSPSQPRPGVLSSRSLNLASVVSDYTDLNLRYQILTRFFYDCRTQGLLDAARRNFQRALDDLIDLQLDFIASVKTYARLIISERYLEDPKPGVPAQQGKTKTIGPISVGGQAGGEKYIVNNILFKFAVDTKGLYGSEHAAAKVAGHELKGLSNYIQCDIDGLCFPMMCLVDFMGFRLIAMTFLPLAKDSIVYGTSDGGASVHADPDFCKMMEQSAKLLNLVPHYCGPGGASQMFSACDIEGHKGTDGRMYLLDFSRSMPPTAPDPKVHSGHLFQLFRSEFLRLYHENVGGKPLCPDAFTGFVRNDPNRQSYNQDIREATAYLKNKHIPVMANKIALSISEATSFGSIQAINLSYEFHSRGINMRYLGHILHHIARKQHKSAPLLLLEIVARVIKNGLRRRLRRKMAELKVPLEAPYSRVIIKYLNAVFSEPSGTSTPGPNSTESAWLGILHWAITSFSLDPTDITRILPNFHSDETPEATLRGILQHMFQPGLPGRFMLINRIQTLTGIKISASAIERLRSSDFSQFVPFENMDFRKHGLRIKYLSPLSTGVAVQSLTLCRMGKFDRETTQRVIENAHRELQLALAATPHDPWLLFQAALASLVKLQLADAETSPNPNLLQIEAQHHFQNAIKWFTKKNPTHPALCDAYLSFSRLLRTETNFIRAEDYLLRALEINPNSTACLNEYIEFLLKYEPSDANITKQFQTRLATLAASGYKPEEPAYTTDPSSSLGLNR